MSFHERPALDQIRLPFLPFRDRDLHENDIGLFQYLYGATQHLEFEAFRIDFHEKRTRILTIGIQWNDVYLASFLGRSITLFSVRVRRHERRYGERKSGGAGTSETCR